MRLRDKCIHMTVASIEDGAEKMMDIKAEAVSKSVHAPMCDSDSTSLSKPHGGFASSNDHASFCHS